MRECCRYNPDTGVRYDDALEDPLTVLKTLGNDAFRNMDYHKALRLYTQALAMGAQRKSISPQDDRALHGNMSLCLLRMGKPTAALEACLPLMKHLHSVPSSSSCQILVFMQALYTVFPPQATSFAVRYCARWFSLQRFSAPADAVQCMLHLQGGHF